jgi:YVTN family beta-propeller protein
VSSEANDVVTVIDIATNTVTASIPMLDPYKLEFSPDGTAVYGGGGATVLKVIATGLRPYQV